MYLLLILLGYIVGSISFSYIAGRIFAQIDIREHGSKNAGATNVLRNVGIKGFFFASTFDILKGAFPVWLAIYFYPENHLVILLTAFATVIGHNWPVFFGFKGGKGIATTIGVALGLHAPTAFIMMLVMAIIVYFTRYMSLASLVATFLLPFLIYFLYTTQTSYLLFAILLTFMAWYRHRGNIKRLLKGIEPKLGEKKK